jgi:hypothetical protein
MVKLFEQLRQALATERPFSLPNEYGLDLPFDPKVSQVYVTLFQEGNKSIRWGSRRDSLGESITRVVAKLKEQQRFQDFDVGDSAKCRILFEMVTKEYPCNIRQLTVMRMQSKNRFEPGVNGLKYTYQGTLRYFMPTDGFTKSIMSVNQLLNYLSKQCGIAKKTNKISERVHLMRREDIDYSFIDSIAYVSYQDEVLELNRGYPQPIEFSKAIVYDRTIKSVDWLIQHMNDDGSFLYFYDPIKNTIVDDMHPNMIDPLYNNILRHSGATITLIRGYELTKKQLYLDKAKASIDFFLTTIREHTYKDQYACYPFFNKKSKLGGAGIGLASIMHYFIQSGDTSYRRYLDGLVRHILSRVDEEGEMIGYFIHPQVRKGKEIIDPPAGVKKHLFSFYYPGEALLGLALYYLHIEDIDPELKEDIREKAEKALDFLVDIRPLKYDYMFEPLPADAWLMQAIEEWVKVDGLKKQSYIDFVFSDTKQMIDHMYTDANTFASNKDYIGGFFYHYGDHVYHDASRCEGVVSAYYLAKYLGDEERAEWIMKSMLLSAEGLMKTFHDDRSVYAHFDSSRTLNSFRFKLTRQWTRVDCAQHAACFFYRLHGVMEP